MWVPGTSNLTCCPGQDGMQRIFCSKAGHRSLHFYFYIDIDSAYFNDIVIREIKRGVFIVLQIFMI